MRYARIDNFDISNGEGVRVVLWTQGCPHRCKGCHNPQTWKETAGKPFTDKERDLIVYYLDEYFPKDFSVLGGEPLAPYNRDGVAELLKHIKTVRPQTNIWLWTGYLWEDVKDLEAVKYIDILIDGRFEIGLSNKMKANLKLRGSSNQRVIDVQKSLKTDEPVLVKKYM